MNLFSDSILGIIFYNLLNSRLQIDSYSDAQKASCDEQNCNFFVDVIYLKLLIWKKIPLERGKDKKNHSSKLAQTSRISKQNEI